MPALSLRQPWAWLVVNGFKPIENRVWSTRFRGKFFVHAAAKMTSEDYEACRIFIDGFSSIELPEPQDLIKGGIVGEAKLVDCVKSHESPWFTGPYGFVLEESAGLPTVRCPGALGFYDPETLKRLA